MARSASAANCIIDFEIAHLKKTHFFLKARCARALRAITRSGTAPPHREGWVGTLPLCSLPKACRQGHNSLKPLPLLHGSSTKSKLQQTRYDARPSVHSLLTPQASSA